MKEGCKTCKFHRKRSLRQKTCLKGYKAVYGFGCSEYQEAMKLNQINNERGM